MTRHRQMIRSGICAAAILALIGVAEASAQQSAPGDTAEPARPAYRFLRYTEDWSVLRDVQESQLVDPWDSLKYVPLSDDADIWASFGGHMRLRVENWSDFGFGAPADPDDTFLLWRLALHADIHFGDNIRTFVEGKTALSSDRDLPGGKRTLDVDSLALEQAFVDVTLPLADGASLTIRPGRQTFLFGKQRLVSPLPWSNTMRRWDGVSGILEHDGWTAHGFWSQFAPVRKYEFNETEADIEFFGVYATGKIINDTVGLDLYYLGLQRTSATFNGTTGPEDRNTIGGRIFGQVADTGFDYDLEGAYQFGEVGAGDISAFMIASELGYRLREVSGSPRLHVGFDYASGDKSPGGDVETFNQLFPLGHAFLGYIDIVGRQNIIDLNAGATITPLESMTVGLTGHLLWRAEETDALYNAGGGVVRAGGLGVDDEVGAELDLTIKYKFDRHLTGLLGYSHFFAGDFIEESGAGEDIDFVYVQLQYVF